MIPLTSFIVREGAKTVTTIVAGHVAKEVAKSAIRGQITRNLITIGAIVVGTIGTSEYFRFRYRPNKKHYKLTGKK